MAERLLTPSKITAWLECAHSLSLANLVDAGSLVVVPSPLGSLAQLLVEKGAEHERNCLQDLENQGRSVYQVPGRNPDESFAQWVERLGNILERDHDVIYQMPFVHEGIRGIADFLVRVTDDQGRVSYEPIDAKLTRTEGKPGHVLQLCFYADAIEHLTGVAPRNIHLWLGSGELETLGVEQFRPYWRRLRVQLDEALARDESTLTTTPEPCTHCEICEFADRCEDQWRSEDSLVYVANIREPERRSLAAEGVETVVELARRDAPVPDVQPDSLVRLRRQASLQVVSRAHPEQRPAFELVEESDDPVYGHGFSLLPRPDEGDVFFDFEGHPFWSAQHDLFFLAGLYLRDGTGAWNYDARWAHDLDQQHDMIHELVEYFAQRRAEYPGMHVYHYNHTERSSMERLTKGTESEVLFNRLVDTGLFVDLFVVSRNAVRVGTESYGLKHLERLTGFVRSGGIEKGAGAVVEYEEYMRSGDERLLDEIARYNEDDVAATLALRDWLVGHRPALLEWREAILEQEAVELDTDELVERLQRHGEHSAEHLLGDLLNYWRRERIANTGPKFAQAQADFTTLYADRDYVANLTFTGFTESTNQRGEIAKYATFTWPPQVIDQAFARQKSVLYTGVGVERGYAYLSEFDALRRTLTMPWRERHELAGAMPLVITLDDYVGPREKPGVLVHLAEQVLDPNELDPPSRVSMDLLARARPRFVEGRGPRDGVFRDSLDETLSWVGDLDESYVAIQGPPGTGKTYSGAHIIHELITQGKRVGITAMSHAAIDNLLDATYVVFEQRNELDRLRVLRRGPKPKDNALAGVRYSTKNADVEGDLFNLVAGTTWLWARPGLRPYPVDVLLIDEAGQLALADAIAAANGARNLLLLGDPLQLAQVSQAEHPSGSGASVLEHVLGEHATIPTSQGVFIGETRRMHPDICTFISEQIYEGRLTSHASCARQTTEFGTGLRWLRAAHEGCSTESYEEADLVSSQILQMLGTPWVNERGESAELVGAHFMVVAPYNDQVRLLREVFTQTPGLEDVQVGTVDKFQGREAPVVFFTMTTSSGGDMPRGPEFLFSRNRLNVAVSRARCLAFLVCTEELLNARARTIEEMRLIGTLCAFVAHATA
ncbi:MAG TPA: TM0106 family RecB-like putative nuclease [Acidimicrobiales bacterium]|nr:TM0106 family RecB-like putative nuclease [Acidimicrobiales bacterium]